MLCGVYGLSRSGKDSLANYLVENHDFERFAFADPLRVVLLEVMDVIAPASSDFIRDNGWDAAKREMGWCVDAMIALGAGMRNHVDPDVWIRALQYQDGQNICVADMRHLNELERIQNLGGKLWKIIRPGTVPRAMDMILNEYKGWDHIYYNNGSLQELYAQVDKEIAAP